MYKTKSKQIVYKVVPKNVDLDIDQYMKQGR